MRNGFLASLGALLASAAITVAQSPSGPAPELVLTGANQPGSCCSSPDRRSDGCCWLTNCCDSSHMTWGSVEYLLWGLENGPIPAALAIPGGFQDTDGDGTVDTFITVGTPIGQSEVYYGTSSGVRATVGGWLESRRQFGIEASAFWLEDGTGGASANTLDAIPTAAGAGLAVPFTDASTGADSLYVIADPFVGPGGSFAFSSRSSLWGAETNAIVNTTQCTNVSSDVLVGFRYLDLDEDLQIATSGSLGTTADRFQTRNQFYGVQLGARTEHRYGRVLVGASGKVAVGNNHQVLDIDGISVSNGSGTVAAGTLQGGIFAQPTNIGRYTRERFAVLPELQLKLGLDLGSGLRTFFSYNILYVSEVLRPGDQVDTVINSTQIPLVGTGPLTGAARPIVPFEDASFWAQGISFGVEMRY